ncbi:MAG TPA: phosphodiester glycosidase family protein [Actinomycetota bacterium]|nr:phosphodiester glycosidase family protein [Actinomycetota bacterium]
MLRLPGNKRNKVIPGALCATLALALALPPGSHAPASARERYRVRRERVAPGLVLVRMYDRKIPNRIRVLRVEPSRELTLDTVLANDKIPGHETTSSMASRKGAIAAINGDYTLLPSDPGAGRPVNLFATDGRLDASPLIWGRNFALSYDEQSAFIGHPKFSATALQHDSGALWKIRDWNVQEPSGAGYAAYTPEGGSLFRTPENACSVRLAAPGAVAWNEDQTGVQQDLVVEAFRCHKRRMARRGGIVLSAPIGTRQATTMQKSIAVGETLTLTWSSGWPGVIETIGGNPTLLEDGAITAEDCEDSYFCDRNPRTGVGVTPSGKVLLVTVDGRQERSVGMTPVEFAKLMEHLGATWALNLDGGGSTAMWVEGGLVNRPSDNPERAVGSALLVLPQPDYEEPVPAPYPGVPVPSPSPSPSTSPSPVPSISPSPSASALEAMSPVLLTERTGFERALPLPLPVRSPRCAALSDPGSTGGMLDALARGDLGPPVRLPRTLRRALDVYRGELSCDRFLRTASSRR